MKVAYVSTYLPTHCGIATYTDYLVSGLREVAKDVDIKIVAEEGASLVKEKKFEVSPCWNREEDYIAPIILNTKGADVIHIQHEYSIYKFDERLPRLLKGLDPKAKKIITIHCIRPAQFSERGEVDENFVKRIASLADLVIVHLESQKAIFKRLGIPDKKIHIIPHGTSLSSAEKEASRRRLRLPLKGTILLMFGFIKKHKCLHIVIDALKEIEKSVENVYLFVAGGLAPTATAEDKEYVEAVHKQIKKLKLQKRVILPNKIFPNEDVPYIFGASDIILFPYYEEDRSASGSFHLAIGAKKPVIASRIPKFEELKEVSDELFIFPYNSEGLAKIIVRLLKDPEFRYYIFDNLEKFRTETSWQVIAKKHLEVYKEEI